MSGKDNFNIAVALAAVLQAGISVIVPVFICALFAKFLMNKCSFPDITMVFAIVLGAISGVYNMFKYIYGIINKKR